MDEMSIIRKKHVPIYLKGKELDFYVVENIEDLITDLSDEDKVPCWADIWPASYGVAEFIWENMDFRENETLMELGAGMGLPGIVAALKGVRVTLSDFNFQALELAAENARQNNVEVSIMQDDWRSFKRRDRYDYLLASDVLYDPKLNPFLGEIFVNNIKTGGKVIISHPERKATYEFLESWEERKLFTEDIFVREVELEGFLLPSYTIAIHILTFSG